MSLKNFSIIALVLGLSNLSLFGANNAVLYNSCRFCHGEKGETRYLDKIEPIKRLDKSSLIALLKEYQKGEIDQIGLGKLMQAQIANFNEAEIEQLADYIVRLNP